MSNRRSAKGRARGLSKGQQQGRFARLPRRRLQHETLEPRTLLTSYVYPYGALPDDTGEYMLGDVEVNVVLMESDPTIAPYDNNSPSDPVHPGRGSPVENWDASSIAAAKANVEAGLQWWKDTLANAFPADANLLDFHINYQYADNPVHTGYEPIDRPSNYFGDPFTVGQGSGWMYDFLKFVGFNRTGDFSSDIRSFNDYTRQHFNTDWATTIFIVNNANDFTTSSITSASSATQFRGTTAPLWPVDDIYNGKDIVFTSGALNGQRGQILDYVGSSRTFLFAPNTFTAAPKVGDTFKIEDDDLFAAGGSFAQAFSYAGGRFMVVPASRPPATMAHEMGHQFWALDEYSIPMYDAHNNPIPYQYLQQRGYYNTQNLNAADNPAPGFVQADSIMSNGASMSNSYFGNTLDPYTMAAIGWQDSDHDGIFDVLDVPFSLSGSGEYNASTGKYEFDGSSHVNTLANRNSAGLQDDITINEIDVVEAKIDDGTWQAVPGATFPGRTYQTSISVAIPVPAGIHDIYIRTKDLQTGVVSNVFQGETDNVTAGGGGVSGMVFEDSNANGAWDSGEQALPNIFVELMDQSNSPLSLMHTVEPSRYDEGTLLNSVESGGTLSAVGDSAVDASVVAHGVSGTGTVFAANMFGADDFTALWNSSRQLQVNFDSPASTVSIRAYGGDGANASYGRLEAYNSANQLVARFTTGALTGGASAVMSVTRAEGDIDHVVAYGRLGTNVILDTLQWGPGASNTTNTFGAYSLGYLPDGAFHVHVSAPAGHFVSTPFGGYAAVTVSGGQTSGSVNFGIASGHPYHNSASPFNVNNDVQNIIAPIDAMMVINFLNSFGNGEGEFGSAPGPTTAGFVDVNDDGRCTPGDALAVINYLNSYGPGVAGEGEQGGEGEQAVSAPMTAASSPTPGQAEGEGQLPVSQTAADYYAQQPPHILDIPDGEESCTYSANMPVGLMAAGAQSPPSVSQGDALDLLGSLTTDQIDADASLNLLSSSPILPISSTSISPQPQSGNAVAVGKDGGIAFSRLSPKLEETLDDISADISQAGSWWGPDSLG